MSGDNYKATKDDNGDCLGYGVYADTLWARIEAALAKDLATGKPLGDDPLVVGIFGEWGSGKSTLLKLVQERANDKLKSAQQADSLGKKNTLTVPVYFQPWKYEHEPHLLVPLVLHVLEATKAALKQTPSFRQQLASIGQQGDQAANKVSGAVHQAAKSARKWYPVLRKIAGSLSVFGVSIDLPPELDDWLGDVETVFESPEAKEVQKAATASEARERRLAFSNDGYHYYRLHELLEDLTRPGTEPRTKDLVRDGANADIRLNFVIFIDDLDRCLPEKAVESLELIKTVFNLESFAFVLALDEEVVERGIGHRYKDYSLVNKKPEMPITGFEYLEKIVHLPFRLPMLTAQQGLQFLARHETALLEEQARRRWPRKDDAQQVEGRSRWLAQRRWFSAAGGRDSGRVHPRERSAAGTANELLTGAAEPGEALPAAQYRLHLAQLVLGSFNAHVPRKLIRVVELFNQVQDVLEAMKPPRWLALGSEYDPRSVLALLLLQLFQPDLYRSLRRSADAFELFFDAFKPLEPSELARQERSRRQLSATTADADLLHWAVYFLDDQPPSTLRAAQQRIPRLDESERHATQHKRLPLVERLLEHRSIQRHPFDPLKLMQLLEQSARADKIPLTLNGNLFALLARETTEALQIPRAVVETVSVSVQSSEVEDLVGGPQDVGTDVSPVTASEGGVLGADLTATQGSDQQPTAVPAFSRRRRAVEATDIREVFLTLVAPDEATQKTVAHVAGLQRDDLLGPKSARTLCVYLEREFLSAEIAPPEGVSVDRLRRFSSGLIYLAPHLAPEDAAFMWKLTKYERPDWGRVDGFETVEQVGQAEREASLFVALGLDDRFEPTRFYLPRDRLATNDRNTEREPIPGFVRVFENKQEVFQPFEGPSVILKPYYMARYLTTVGQYACFVDGGGYGELGETKPAWWDTLGWAWRTGQWDSKVTEGTYRELLGRRKPELRGAPMQWSQQLTHGSRPVMNLNWFEARAYAQWLTGRLQEALHVRLPGYAVCLPSEAQWERAARAANRTQAEAWQYPWGGADVKNAHLHANVSASDIVRVSPVGLFAPSPLGLCDVIGNLWEWQNNLYQGNGNGQDDGLNLDVKVLKTHEDRGQSDRPALRGGAWRSSAVFARASIRSGYRPDFAGSDVGFRVVLSLANLSSET